MLQAALKRVASRLRTGGRLPGVRVNPRLRTTRARYLRTPHVIEVSRSLIRARRSDLERVLAHELAHALVTRRYPGARPHGPEWRDVMVRAGLTPFEQRRSLKASAPPTRQHGRFHYEHRCPVCQMRRIAKRPVSQWRCTACVGIGLAGLLQVQKVKRE
jgi:predicted SprT family Zn-dependent metalloprotease